MNKMCLLLILFTVFMFSMTSSWLQMWALLEINMMLFIPLMYNNNSTSINAMLKYFFIQAVSSSLFLMSYMLFMYSYSMNYNIIMAFSMLTKLGMFPMFMWFPQVASQISWFSNLILMTVQKSLPMFILSFLNSYIIYISLIMSAAISVLGLWNQNNLKFIMAYSSINHMSWMLISIYMKNMTWILYLNIYIMMMISIIMLLNNYNIKAISQMNLFNTNFSSFMMIINFWSLGGLPPFVGFLPKWIMILNISNEYYFMFFIMMMTSLLSILIYTRLIYSNLLNPILTKSLEYPKMYFMQLMTLMLFPLMVLMM